MSVQPLRLTLNVACGVEHAFTVWTTRIDTWWPADHTVSGTADATVVLEPFVGGRIFERTTAGDEHDWGRVTVWQPPTLLGYTWHLRADAADATDVRITFEPAADGTTRLVIEHSGWDRLGARAADWRQRNQGGWATLLPHYTAAIAGRS